MAPVGRALPGLQYPGWRGAVTRCLHKQSGPRAGPSPPGQTSGQAPGHKFT
jgi:hypothetical protein